MIRVFLENTIPRDKIALKIPITPSRRAKKKKKMPIIVCARTTRIFFLTIRPNLALKRRRAPAYKYNGIILLKKK